MLKEKYKKISSLQNPAIKHFVKLIKESAYREKIQRVPVIGKSLILELSQLLALSSLFILEGTPLSEVTLFSNKCSNIYIISSEVFKKMGGSLEHSPENSWAAEFFLPKPSPFEGKNYILALDAISDPGNLGTLIRTATALNWDGVFLLPGCCDLFNDKVIRASRGACLLFPFCKTTLEEINQFSQKEECPLYIAHTKGEEISSLPKSKKVILLLSNEAHGVREEIKNKGKEITIAISSQMESLNVAAAGSIIMHHLKPYA
jgi:RNA methyltransferase, TrmH family